MMCLLLGEMTETKMRNAGEDGNNDEMIDDHEN